MLHCDFALAGAVHDLLGRVGAAKIAEAFDEHGLHLSVRVPASSYPELAARLATGPSVVAGSSVSPTMTVAAMMGQPGQRPLERGEIGYLEWVLLVNQAIEIKAQYLNAVQRRNEIAFRIEELQGL